MHRFTAPALLFCAALFLGGCKSVPPAQTAQPTFKNPRSASAEAYRNARAASPEAYNNTYEFETRHHHHHGPHQDVANDHWTGYDRTDAADIPGMAIPNDDTRRSRDGQQPHHNARAITAKPGQFDFYVLNLSWSPAFCSTHPSAAECAQHRAFTLHGLWPQNNDGSFPEDCSNAPGPANPSQYADIYPDASLLHHEWQTHGTCSGLAPDAFLALDRRAEQSIKIPDELQNLEQQTTLAPAQIITLFTQANPSLPTSSLALSCGNNILTAVEVCLNKSLKPEACNNLKTCGATQIKIPAPPQ